MNLWKLSDTTKPVPLNMVDNSNPLVGKTGLTVSVQVSKNGGAFAAGGGTVTELQRGIYSYAPAAADLNTLGVVIFQATATGAVDFNVSGRVVAFDPYDANALGLTYLSNLNTRVPSTLTITSGAVTVAGYASGQDPATLVLSTPANKLLTNASGFVTATGGGGSDPWLTALPGSYAAGTAGYILGTNLNATVTSRMATFALPTNFSSLAVNGSGQVLLDLTQSIPHGLAIGSHGRILEGIEGQAIGKWITVGTALTLYREDGTTIVRVFTLDSSTAPTSRT